MRWHDYGFKMMRMLGEDCRCNRKRSNSLKKILTTFRHFSTSVTTKFYHTTLQKDSVFLGDIQQLCEHTVSEFILNIGGLPLMREPL
jgi:hypothetical protein